MWKQNEHRNRTATLWAVVRFLVLGLCIAAFPAAPSAQTEEATVSAAEIYSVRTDSPQETFRSFQTLHAKMEAALLQYLETPSFAGVSDLALLSDQMNGLLDLTSVPASSRREVGIRTMTYLMDIFGRLPEIPAEAVPNAEWMEAEGKEAFRIPDTPIYIGQVLQGDRTGEYLFTAATVDVAARFFRAVEELPLRTALPVRSYTALGPQLTGPIVPSHFVEQLPPALRTLWLDTPAWKVLTSVFAAALLVFLALTIRRLLKIVHVRAPYVDHLLKAALACSLIFFSSIAMPAFSFQINVSGRFADFLTTLQTAISYIAIAWLVWIAIGFVFEWIVRSAGAAEESPESNLAVLLSKILGLIGVIIVLALGGQAIGLPVVSVVAGLGIGGLAVALAIQPTLENLIGGLILYVDRPVRVGDFCQFGEQKGTIEAIGVRSTKLRALDRTVITVPNAQFADLQIINFAQCDRMLVQTVIGVRYETTPDQLRHLLAEIRSMLHAHPRVERETVRVRFEGFGASSLDIGLRIYVMSREWNDFFAVREDIYFRIYDLVVASGTGFAFPSQTVYFGRDDGIDTERGAAAEKVVASWRRKGRLPFPRFSNEELDRIDDTLDYPPKGSSSYGKSVEEEAEAIGAAEERLSAEDVTLEDKPPSKA